MHITMPSEDFVKQINKFKSKIITLKNNTRKSKGVRWSRRRVALILLSRLRLC